MSRYVPGKAGGLLAAMLVIAFTAAPGWAAVTDHPVPLNYNFHGMVHGGAELGVPDDVNGYRGISDRGLYFDAGDPSAFGSQPLVGATGIPYALFNTLNPNYPSSPLGQLDLVHLGNRNTLAPFNTDPNDNRGSFPAWMPDANSCDHTGPQTTTISPGIVIDGATEIGVLYDGSNGGGNFNVTLHFTDNSTVTAVLAAPDWYGGNRTEPGIVAGQPVLSQKMITATVDGFTNNSFTGCSNTDRAVLETFRIDNSGPNLNVVEGIIDTALISPSVAGKTLNSIIFQRQSAAQGFAIYAVTVRTGTFTNTTCAAALPVSAGETAGNNVHVLYGSSAASSCGGGNDTNGLWYRYVATGTRTIQARTCGASFDTTLSVYTGSCGSLTQIACNDDGCGTASLVTWSATNGTPYYIRVAGKNNAAGLFTLGIDDPMHVDVTMPLQFNWNGICHGPSEQTTASHENRSDLNGYRAIADRGLLCDGVQIDALNYGGTIGYQGIRYTVYGTALQSDMVHLGNRNLVAGGARAFSPPGTTWPPSTSDNGLWPIWLNSDDQTGPQSSSMSTLNAVFGPNTKVGLLYHASDVSTNYYASFDVTLDFTDFSSVTLPVLATDWFVTNGQVMPGPAFTFGVEAMRLLGIYHGVQNTDRASDAGTGGRLKVDEAVISTAALQAIGFDPVGKTLAGITFGNPISGNAAGDNFTSAFGIYAATLRDPASYNPNFGPGGVGTLIPNQLVAGARGKITVSVSRGSGSPNNITSVIVDGSSVGLSPTLALYDDGTHGDLHPNDNIWSVDVSFFVDMPPQPGSLPFTVTDAQSRTATGDIIFTIVSPAGTFTPATTVVGSLTKVTVTMSSDGTATPGISSIVLNGSAWGLGNITLNDTGTGGDTAPNDGIYSATVRVPLGVPVGATTLPFTVTQPAHTFTGNAGLTVAAPAAAVAPWPEGVVGTTARYTVDMFPATDITSVSADLSAIGLGTLALNDSGTNGDVTAGDGIWSANFTVPASAPLGAHALPFTVHDSHSGLFTGSANFTVLAVAPMMPIPVTGWNRDIVVEREAVADPNNGFNAYADPFDVPNRISFYEAGTVGGNTAGTKGLPVGGAFVSLADGLTAVQLQPYGNGTAKVPNALVLDDSATSGTLTLTTPQKYTRLAFIVSSANAAFDSLGNITLTFTDNTTASGTTYSALRYYGSDWYFTQSPLWYSAFLNTGRTWLDYGGWIDDDPTPGVDNPRLYQATVYLGTQGLNAKAIRSITFDRPSGAGSTAILAVSGEVQVTHPLMTPIVATGYDADVVVEASAVPNPSDPNGPYAAYAQSFDAGGVMFYEAGLAGGSTGLPAGSAVFTSSADGATQIHLQPYNAPNVLLLDATTAPSGTLTLAPAAQKAYGRLAIVGASANATQSSAGTLTITFTDNSTATGLSYDGFDWFWQPTDVAINGVGTVDSTGSFAIWSVFEPRLYQTTLDLAGHVPPLSQKPIKSLTFDLASGATRTGIFALSGILAGPPVCRGDCNCDGTINFGDINPFVAALTNPANCCNFANCDVNGDGVINFADINPFVAKLSPGGPCP